jgi:hypothetical protein
MPDASNHQIGQPVRERVHAERSIAEEPTDDDVVQVAEHRELEIREHERGAEPGKGFHQTPLESVGGSPRHHPPGQYRLSDDAGQLSPDERPDAEAGRSCGDGYSTLDEGSTEVGDELLAELELLLQQHLVDGAQCLENKAECKDSKEGGDQRLAKE